MTYTASSPPSNGSIRLRESFPQATSAECDRFDKAFQRHASDHLDAYLAWRSHHGMDDDDTGDNTVTSNEIDSGHAGSDELHWSQAVDRAMAYIRATDEANENNKNNRKINNGKSSPKESETTTTTTTTIVKSESSSLSESSLENSPPLVQFVRCHWVDDTDGSGGSYLKDKTGHRILHLLPAQISKDACIESYILTLSFYLERKLHRDNDEQVTLLVDVRSGQGWPNVPASQMITFVRRTTSVLAHQFPNRLHKCIIYPMPRATLIIWTLMQAFMSASLRNLIVLFAGAAEIESPPPHTQLEEYVHSEGLALLEEARRQSFSYN
jgi:CRAL/TRIO domain